MDQPVQVLHAAPPSASGPPPPPEREVLARLLGVPITAVEKYDDGEGRVYLVRSARGAFMLRGWGALMDQAGFRAGMGSGVGWLPRSCSPEEWREVSEALMTLAYEVRR